ncbi:MAG TPA: bifunctional salicylyl-CoA 5-hydroxylase/oxidoreductase [Alphaproteobacteria bacterium]|nr:bifunctional salicylyl-CoA 5-hydroxylase/oxidoreductase [Alphaproteobacteria bacterium]
MRVVIIGGGPAGLYTAILLKKAQPDASIEVYERNRAHDTFGFGVVFSDETLDNFLSRDPESYGEITDTFAYWDDIDFRWHDGTVVRSGGHGFCGCGRVELLAILQRRCAQIGVPVHFETEITDPAAFPDADLIVAADGVNSAIRETYKTHFKPSVEWRRNRFVWLGSTKPCEAFTFNFAENEHGIWVLGEYQYNADLATWIIEAPEATWASAAAEVEHLSEPELLAYMEALWADYLDGHKLVANRSIWRVFPTIRCERWSHENIVLIGDALHTAHYSIGSGTKLAMEDAIALVDAVTQEPTIPAALTTFEEGRRQDVEITQHAADVSVIWTENPHRYWKMAPLQATFSMLSRSKQVTYDNLRLRDAGFVDKVDRWFAEGVREEGFEVPLDPPPPPMFTPFKMRGMVLANRVVVSPMDMYSAVDGTVGDFHHVHMGSLALGGAGLVFSEMVCVSAEGRITPGCGGLYKDEHVAAWAHIAEFIHRESDAKLAIQLGHAGRKGSTRVAWEGMDQPLEAGNWELIAPSALPHYPFSATPREMSRADMEQVRDQFVASAKMANEAGADMLELHMAHGYLLSGFITPVSNQRDDDHGGALENRLRYPLEVFDAVRAAWPQEKPMSVRISATDWVGAAGITGEDAVVIAQTLGKHGCDLVDVSAGQTTPDAEPVYGRMFQTPFAEQVRNEAGIPTIAVGNITTWDQVNTILAAGRADLVALARPHLTNPHFTLQAAAFYGHAPQRWPVQYDSGKEQAFRLAARDRADAEALRGAAKPASHRKLAAE